MQALHEFDNKPYSRKIEKPWGWELHWTPDELPYMGKILHINEGHRISLQSHDEKRESWLLISGKAKIIWENAVGELEELEMETGKGYSVDLEQKHRLAGITDCDIVEVSTPERGSTQRWEDDYDRAGQIEDEAERVKRNRGEL